MKTIQLGLAKKKRKWMFFGTPTFFIRIPVDRNICVSDYLIHITKSGAKIRLANKFFKEYKKVVVCSKLSSIEKENAILDWAKSNPNNVDFGRMKYLVLRVILHFSGKEDWAEKRNRKLYKTLNEDLNKIIKFLNKQ